MTVAISLRVGQPLIVSSLPVTRVARAAQLPILVDGYIGVQHFMSRAASEDIDDASDGASEVHLRFFLIGRVRKNDGRSDRDGDSN